MRYLCVLLACTALQGCWFVYVPYGLFASGNSCAAEGAVVGQRLLNRQTGKTGTIKELHGRSDRCQDSQIPILATVEYD